MVIKKRIIIIPIISVEILIVGGYSMLNTLSPKISILGRNARLSYVYNNKNIKVDLSADESQRIKEIFNGKRLYNDNPSCGFTENVSIRFDNLIFCVARDECPIIQLGNQYIKISEGDREIVNGIFEKYGGSFPCV